MTVFLKLSYLRLVNKQGFHECARPRSLS